MEISLGLSGLGHALGSTVISNRDLAKSLGMPNDWFVERTGIEERRICSADEDVVSLGAAAVTRACEDASLDPDRLGNETVLIHIQNGFTHLTPPAGVVLAGQMDLSGVRVLGLDGVCAEPIAALELATLMLSSGSCERVIISAAVDFLTYINPKDPDTAGLFGAGAGAVIISKDTTDIQEMVVRGIHWESHTEHWQMGEVDIRHLCKTDIGVDIAAGFYEMKGQSLYRQALRVLPHVIDTVLGQADWKNEDVELIVIHQPNAKMLQMGSKRLGLNLDIMPLPVRRLGNMGPASLLVNLSLARDEGRLAPGTRVLLLAFGLGFSCGAAAVEV
ncbi:3-oxoacyl-ACP synthase III family protein [Streptomyces sp. NEAU-174]|uniref:3-oxoacyl-ACP synthase III family protein n=1 Tax=Streptomyces sp. NEAU-174 TaxID=3458254 RepID=UPI0040441317